MSVFPYDTDKICNMEICNKHDPDKVFKRFKLVEFPICFVGLSTSKKIEVENNLDTSAYFKTMYEGRLMKFEEARNISASHRAFDIKYVDDHNILITFKPTNQCVFGTNLDNNYDNRIVVEMHLIQADGLRCCNNELHAEIGRYYISGQFEHIKLVHEPKTLDFGDVKLKTTAKKYFIIRNESNLTTVRLRYLRSVGFQVLPEILNIKPHSSQEVLLIVKPNSIKVNNHIRFQISNSNCLSDKLIMEQSILKCNDNMITYKIACKIKVVCPKISPTMIIESLHILQELNPAYTYVGEELIEMKKRKGKTTTFFDKSKITGDRKAQLQNIITKKEMCNMKSDNQIYSQIYKFCEQNSKILSIYDVFCILPRPVVVDFGRVGLSSYAKQELTIKNDSSSNITLNFFPNEYISYTENKEHNLKIKLKPYNEKKILLYCFGYMEGNFSGNFEYSINQKYFRKHSYILQVGSPTIMLLEKSLKFGMVTMESFVTSLPVKIINYFNVDVDFKWSLPHDDMPFEVIPHTCCLPGRTSRMCDVIYKCKPTKAKLYEIDFNFQKKVVPVEVNVITRKLSIKFLKSNLTFNDIALNVETYENIKLENSSREVAFFHVVEPLMHGFNIAPISGIIGPKMIITFNVILKISCIIDFNFDLVIKINNKENLILPVCGNVIEPRINIIPRTVYMPRIPCNLLTYVQVMLQNTSNIRSHLEVLHDNDDNCFKVFEHKGNEKHRVRKFDIDGGQSKTISIQIYGNYRQEYDFYMPLKINGIIGPPNNNPSSHDLHYYVQKNEICYENNTKVKIKPVNKEISFCRLIGVISLPQLKFSIENYEIRYNQSNKNSIEFTMSNVSKLNLLITVVISKLMPNFSLTLLSDEHLLNRSENQIKLGLQPTREAEFCLRFHPKSHGKFVSTALLYLNANMNLPFFNLTFIGLNEKPMIKSKTSRIIFPPCYVGTEIWKTFTLTIDTESDLDSFSFQSNEPDFITVKLLSLKVLKDELKRKYTLFEGKIIVSSQEPIVTTSLVSFKHSSGSSYNIEVKFCFTYCPLTLHTDLIVKIEENPFPFYPLNTQCHIFNYMEKCSKFLEKWMFYQGFRKELYPKIPDTLNALSTAMTSQGKEKSKGINVSYLNFVRRIIGPLMKHIHKITITDTDESFKQVKEIYKSYEEIFNILKSRGANLWALEPQFLLSYDQFIIYSANTTSKSFADENFSKMLSNDEILFRRLNKQSWIDFILQSYKVFILDSCFFDCICVSSQLRDILNIVIIWYNEQLQMQFNPSFIKDTKVKCIKNITTDLCDGIAIISAFLNNCSFLNKHFSSYSNVKECECDSGKINNACLIIEAINLLRLNFPIRSKDFLEPNFIQMLFLSINLYVVLPMFKPKDTIKFNPPLLKSSTRKITISPTNQESLTFSYSLLDNAKNNFAIEKLITGDNGKRVIVNVTYTANFVDKSKSVLLMHGYNKTRIFDTYVLFILSGTVGVLNPLRKCKVSGPNYRQQKVDILLSSPFTTTSTYQMYIFDTEPTLPLNLDVESKFKFYARRLNLIDKEVVLSGIPKESGQEILEHKVYFHLICLDAQINNTWVWFRSDIGEFFIKITTQPRCDLFLDTLFAKIDKWPLVPCSCGESCKCYRTTALMIPNRNDFLIKSLRSALSENASEKMIEIFDQLIETSTGRIVLGMLLAEGGMNASDLQHILRNETSFRVTARALKPRFNQMTLAQHTESTSVLPITVPSYDRTPEKYSVTFTSDCGMDVRTYKVSFVESA